jgi:hypothetical protein
MENGKGRFLKEKLKKGKTIWDRTISTGLAI